MATSLILKEQALVTLTSTGASLTTGSGAAAGTTLDARAAGNAADFFAALFELTAQWGTVTGIAAGTVIADLYLVPALDGTNYPDVDMTAGTSYIPFSMRVGSFVASKVPTASTNARFVSNSVDLLPVLYQAYIINRSGQTISVNWALKVAASAAQSV
jgi:hypothetical protein